MQWDMKQGQALPIETDMKQAQALPIETDFRSVSYSAGSGHAAAVNKDGTALTFSRGSKGNRFGQLGRGKDLKHLDVPQAVSGVEGVKYVYTGGTKDSGHTALLTQEGVLWMAGCDRWQQLGLGSPGAGAAGYTWGGGQIWQSSFKKNSAIASLMAGDERIVDVALGGDHTAVLTSSKNVYCWGRGGQGQLGVAGAPFVSAPMKSTKLSGDPAVRVICALRDCTATVNEDGNVINSAGKCEKVLVEGFKECLRAAKHNKLI